jgi:hypothetical protein
MLKGVSVTRRKRLKPAEITTSRIRGSPACAPRHNQTSYDREQGVHSSVENESYTRPTGFKLSFNLSWAKGSTIIHVPSLAKDGRTCAAAPVGSPMSCRQSNTTTKVSLLGTQLAMHDCPIVSDWCVVRLQASRIFRNGSSLPPVFD